MKLKTPPNTPSAPPFTPDLDTIVEPPTLPTVLVSTPNVTSPVRATELNEGGVNPKCSLLRNPSRQTGNSIYQFPAVLTPRTLRQICRAVTFRVRVAVITKGIDKDTL